MAINRAARIELCVCGKGNEADHLPDTRGGLLALPSSQSETPYFCSHSITYLISSSYRALEKMSYLDQKLFSPGGNPHPSLFSASSGSFSTGKFPLLFFHVVKNNQSTGL